MKTTNKLAALVMVVATLVAPSLFADERHRGRTEQGRNSYRTVTVEGRISDIDRDRNGFVIGLNRDNQRLFASVDTRVQNVSGRNQHRTRVRDLEQGDFIRAIGRRDNRGWIYVDSITLVREEDDRHDGGDRRLSGSVVSIDYRRNIMVVQSDRGRSVTVDISSIRRRDLDDIRRNDRVLIRGDWQRNGLFEAERVEEDRRSRW